MVVTSQGNPTTPVPPPSAAVATTATRPGRPRTVRKPGRHTPTRSAAARRRDLPAALLLILPAVAGFAVFFAYPTLRGIYLSFTDFHVLTPPHWVGLANFREMSGDDVFWHSLLVTVYFVVLSVCFGTLISLVTAVVLHRVARSSVLRGVILLPFLISNVIAALVWQWMLDPQLGVVNIVLRHLTGHSILFFGSGGWAIPSLAAISVWKWMGYYALLIFAGLQTIPPTIYEAGRVDGASEVQMFRRLTVPLLRPILVMVVVLTVINSFQVFDIVQVTTRGGPANASNVLQMYIFDKAFRQFDFGYAATLSLALFALLITVTFTQLRLARAGESDLN
ncbi:carbohydrate ABC transporter permease [Streptomyces sp. NPDC003753]|uniref:carbohydrate ABC transporter permease n=1 Tax=unclassified Streptomyces TaxID=2593676 RepID=UPI001908ACE6|nr:sugar ABC transporter permease [Streptomyces sp. Y2F8-2]GHK03842.1 sugar ABC transporter permease [Streptomyces sp. Y2F8-2]GHK04882.1 sugar ABC transporter permease [Streptomyces sp. Y2F8-2]